MKTFDDYKAVILSNVHDTPKSIVDLMAGVGAWETSDASDACEELVKENKISLHHSTGPFFQHEFYVRVA